MSKFPALVSQALIASLFLFPMAFDVIALPQQPANNFARSGDTQSGIKLYQEGLNKDAISA